MNPTHRHLAEISRFRQAGYLIKEGSEDLLLRDALPHLQLDNGAHRSF
jgi:hypothetical protein